MRPPRDNGPLIHRTLPRNRGGNEANRARFCVRFPPPNAGGYVFERADTGGFSLIEVMVAILILGIAVVGLVHGITTALASSKESELQTVAALFAQGKIEQLRAEGILEDGEDEGGCGTILALYSWKQSITGTDIPGLHEVDVVVQHAQTQRGIYELKTLLFEPEDDSSTNSTGARKDSKSRSKGAS